MDSGTVPIGPGDIEVYMDQERIKVRGTHGDDTLKYKQNGRLVETQTPCNGEWVEVSIK